MTRRIVAHAYPWDVAGDPAFVERLAGLGPEEVTLAAAYHSVRAATPLHPRHQVVEAPHAALYRPVRAEAWTGRRLRPHAASWMGHDDSFAAAAQTVRESGRRVNAWVVLNHNSRLGADAPDIAVINCFGDRYPYALCPGHAEVREYAETLTRESLRDVQIDGVSLEAWGQLGVKHAGLHDKTADAWSAEVERLLSVCCCSACRKAWTSLGLDPQHVVAQLRDAVAALQHGDAIAAGEAASHAPLSEDVEAAILTTRHQAMVEALTLVLNACREEAPAARVTAHAHPDPWSGVPIDAVHRAASAGEVAAVLVPTWPTTLASAEVIASAARMAGPDLAVGAYLTVLPPADRDEVAAHARRLVEHGADELHLYHAGLAGTAQWQALAQARDAFRTSRS